MKRYWESIFWQFLAYILWICFFHFVIGKFHVDNAGHFPVDEDDMGIRFFVTVTNNLNKKILVSTGKAPECCWKVDDDETDCESMILVGGFEKEIDGKTSKNMSFMFSNLYPLDRVGSCKFYLKEGKDKQFLVHEMKFDTTPTNEDTSSSTVYGGGGNQFYKACDTVDNNIRNSCKPFDCSAKYNGFRNYYNKVTKRCEPVFTCATPLGDDDLPDSAFDMDFNSCKSLEPKMSKEEQEAAQNLMKKSPLQKEINQYADINAEEIVLSCKNGYQEDNYCRCNRGWKTVSKKTKDGALTMDWCSKKVPIIPSKATPTARWTVFGMLTIATTGFLVLIGYLWWRWFLGDMVRDYLERRRSAAAAAKEVYSDSEGEGEGEHSPTQGKSQKRQDYSDEEEDEYGDLYSEY